MAPWMLVVDAVAIGSVVAALAYRLTVQASPRSVLADVTAGPAGRGRADDRSSPRRTRPYVGREPFAAHLRRLGPLPGLKGRRAWPGVLEAAGLLGRGGAGFPVGRKWRVRGVAEWRWSMPSSSRTAPRASRSARRLGRRWPPGHISAAPGRASGRRRGRRPDRAVHRRGPRGGPAGGPQSPRRAEGSPRTDSPGRPPPSHPAATSRARSPAAVHARRYGRCPTHDHAAATVRARHRPSADPGAERGEPGATPRSSRAGAIPGIARPARARRAAPPSSRSAARPDGSARSRSGCRSASSPEFVDAPRGGASAAAGRLFWWPGPRREAWDVPLEPVALRRGVRVRLRGRGVPAVDRLRRRDDRPDPGLHGWPERRPVRSVRVRPAGHRRRHPADPRRVVRRATTSSGSSGGHASSPVEARVVTPTARWGSS